MSTLKFLFYHMLLALAIVQAGATLPMVHFINGFGKGSDPVELNIDVRGLSSSTQIKPGQDYGMRVKVDDIYSVYALHGLKFTGFDAYNTARDKGRAAVFWRANDDGFDMSYDKVHWKKMAPWETE